jgi:assimilatory nitrate reductase catalytic subunit
VVVSDCVRHTDTTACADILLPALAWGEKDGTVTNSERCISRQRAFLPAPGEAKADWWIVCQVARRLGFAGAFAYTQPAEIFREHARLSGFKNDGARAFDIGVWSKIEENQYDTLLPTQWPVTLQMLGGTTRLFADGKFYTKSGRARMVAIEPRLPAQDADYPFVLNTGRIRDQWHTMTRTGNVPRLNAQRPETFVEVRPCDAIDLPDGSLARISSRFGSTLARVQLSSDQRRGSLFVPMHWSDTFARAARVDALVAPVTDPISGQPESKHSAVCIEPFNPAWQGFLLNRTKLELAGLPYCARCMGAGHWRHELAGAALPVNWRNWLSEAAGPAGEWMEYRDQAKGIYRAAILSEGKLQAVFFVARDHLLPEREWLAGLFEKPMLEPSDLAGLLAARPPQGCDAGRTVCACYGVGEKSLQSAIRDQGLKTIDEVGQCTKAGTGCGSCVPEIRRLMV